jgi:RND family efflux transporter MFP subunit
VTRPTLTKILTVLVLLAAVGFVAGLRVAATAKEPHAPKAEKADAARDAAPDKKDAPAGANEGAAETEKAVTYPVVTVAPVPHSFRQVVRGYGAIRADARSALSVSMATVGVVRSVEVLPGERVKQGQPLFTVEPDPLAYLAYQQAVSAAKLARAEVARLTAQRADQLATDTQLESAQKALADAEAGVEAARRQGAAGGAEVLRAPVDGIVTALGAGIGDRPAVGATLAAIAPANAARVLLGIEPGEARLVHVGDRVTVRPVQTGPRERAGHVVVAGASLDKDTRLVSVAVALDQAGFDDYLAGTAVEAAIETRAIDAFSVPRSAIVKDEEGTAVFEVTGGKAHRVPVVIEVDEGARVGISGALDKARPVVTTGAYELQDGAAVAEPTH